jgi:hypothetical protein
VTYVEPLPEPTTAELQRDAQEEAQVFASLGKLQLNWTPSPELIIRPSGSTTADTQGD